MLYWVIQIIVVSVIFILVVHNIFNFLKTTLTVPKAKDLVDVHMEKYKHIYATLKKDDDLSGMINPNHLSSGTTNIDDIPMVGDETLGKPNIGHLLSSSENKSMKNELKNFMKKQLSGKPLSPENNSQVQYMPL